MYKVFFKNKEIILTNRKTIFYTEKKTQLIDFDAVDHFRQKVTIFLRSKKYHHLIIFSENVTQLKKSFFGLFFQIKAAGGIVFNSEKEILMIKKNGYWDFPKGKAEKGEKLKTTAVREIKEETNINAVLTKDKPYKTYHIYHYHDELAIKTTYWYEMKQGKKSKPEPEKKEGIEKAKWVDKESAIEKIDKSFLSLKYLLAYILK